LIKRPGFNLEIGCVLTSPHFYKSFLSLLFSSQTLLSVFVVLFTDSWPFLVSWLLLMFVNFENWSFEISIWILVVWWIKKKLCRFMCTVCKVLELLICDSVRFDGLWLAIRLCCCMCVSSVGFWFRLQVMDVEWICVVIVSVKLSDENCCRFCVVIVCSCCEIWSFLYEFFLPSSCVCCRLNFIVLGFEGLGFVKRCRKNLHFGWDQEKRVWSGTDEAVCRLYLDLDHLGLMRLLLDNK